MCNDNIGVESPMYYEDFSIHDTFVTAHRTVSWDYICEFAELSGDKNPLHTGPEYCKGTAFGRPIAHGLLGFSMFTGLLDDLDLWRGSALAFLGISEWRFLSPIHVGEILEGEISIADKRLSQSIDSAGMLVRDCVLRNAEGDVLQKGRTAMLIRTRGDM